MVDRLQGWFGTNTVFEQACSTHDGKQGAKVDVPKKKEEKRGSHKQQLHCKLEHLGSKGCRQLGSTSTKPKALLAISNIKSEMKQFFSKLLG